MPYKSHAKRLEHARRWRKLNPNYMRDYARRHKRRVGSPSEVALKIQLKLAS